MQGVDVGEIKKILYRNLDQLFQKLGAPDREINEIKGKSRNGGLDKRSRGESEI